MNPGWISIETTIEICVAPHIKLRDTHIIWHASHTFCTNSRRVHAGTVSPPTSQRRQHRPNDDFQRWYSLRLRTYNAVIQLGMHHQRSTVSCARSHLSGTLNNVAYSSTIIQPPSRRHCSLSTQFIRSKARLRSVTAINYCFSVVVSMSSIELSCASQRLKWWRYTVVSGLYQKYIHRRNRPRDSIVVVFAFIRVAKYQQCALLRHNTTFVQLPHAEYGSVFDVQFCRHDVDIPEDSATRLTIRVQS
jgi:hypothetical protein